MSDLEKRLNQIEQKMDAVVNIPSPYYGANVQQNNNDEIDLRELWDILWQGKWLIVGVTFLFAVIGVVYALSLPNMYTSEGVYAPAQNQSSSSLGGQFGGLAAIAGINLGGGESSDVDQAMALVVSWPFLENIVNANNLAPYVLAVKEWNKKSGRLVWDSEIYDVANKKWLVTDPDKPAEPTSYDVFDAFNKMIGVSNDAKTGMVTLSVTHYSPKVAERWVRLLISSLNSHFQNRDVVESKRNIDYLESKIEETSIREMQSVFYDMIESQIQTLMLAEVSEEYLLKEIIPPKIAERKSKPAKALICILFVFLGVFFACGLVLVRGVLKKPQESLTNV